MSQRSSWLRAARCAALVLGVAGTAAPALAQDHPEWAAQNVAPTLLGGNPDAVVRLDEHTFDVQTPGRARETVRRVVTVFRATGRAEAEAAVYYDRFRRVEKLEGRLYDHAGKLLRRAGRDEVNDVSATDAATLADDLRLKTLALHDAHLPYTVEVRYELRHEGLLTWPAWVPQDGTAPVERSTFRLRAPATLAVATHATGAIPTPTEGRDGGQVVRTWTAEHLTAPPDEPFRPATYAPSTVLRFAPETFEIGGVTGSFASWQAFGDFYARLSEGRQRLPDAARADVARLVAGITDPAEKARRLYAYIQARTRYVSIQLGLGGWQPLDATFVHGRGYGDCKALTNYLVALLAEAGVPARPALVRAGRQAPALVPAFPSNVFNHVIVAVPLAQDTVWLEATSQTLPFGHLGSFTEGRDVLLIEPGASRLVSTPTTEAPASRELRTARITLAPTGAAAATVSLVATGNEADGMRDRLLAAPPAERQTWLLGRFDAPGLTPEAMDFSGVAPRTDTVRVTATLRMPRFATSAGRRLFVPLALERWRGVPPPATAGRVQPVAFMPYAFDDEDRLEITIPDGMRSEALPAPLVVETPFARFERTVREDAGTLVVTRRLQVLRPTLPPEAYDAVRAFTARLADADRAQVVLVPTNGM